MSHLNLQSQRNFRTNKGNEPPRRKPRTNKGNEPPRRKPRTNKGNEPPRRKPRTNKGNEPPRENPRTNKGNERPRELARRASPKVAGGGAKRNPRYTLPPLPGRDRWPSATGGFRPRLISGWPSGPNKSVEIIENRQKSLRIRSSCDHFDALVAGIEVRSTDPAAGCAKVFSLYR